MEKTTLYLPAELQLRLKEAARSTGRPQAELIRDAVTEYLDKQPRRLPRSIGMLSGAFPDAVGSKRRVLRDWDWMASAPTAEEYLRRKKAALRGEMPPDGQAVAESSPPYVASADDEPGKRQRKRRPGSTRRGTRDDS